MSSHQTNVIVFFTDQQRFDCSSLHGNPLDLMPNFDRLARQGTHLYNSFTCQPVCTPARCALQTGLYPTATGVFKLNIKPPPDAKMLGSYFAEAGYSTGYIGKWHLGEPANNDPSSHGPVSATLRGGYQEWLASNVLEFTSDDYRTRLFDSENNPVDLPGYRVDALTDAAIRYVDRHKKDPFFLFLSFIEPHFQNHRDDYPAPQGYRERYTGRWTPPDLEGLPGSWPRQLGGYWGMVKRLDEALGRLNDCLISLGLADDTIILFTSDHGCSFKTRLWHAYKQTCHESAIRVPTMFSGGPFAGGGQIQKLVSIIDIPPTLLDVAGIPVPDFMQGRSILPLLRGGHVARLAGEPARRGSGGGVDWPDEVLVQISETGAGPGRAVRTSRWKYAVNAPDVDGSRFPGSDHYVETELYDLYADPYELNNLIGFDSHRKVADILQARLIRRMVAAGETAPTIEPAKSKPGGQYQVYEDELNS